MILKASQRGGARQLALHLLNSKDNEHVEVHEVSGFLSSNLVDAMHETYAISKGTFCKQFLFSLSLSPPEQESVPVEAFENTIERVEQDMKLTGQPRAIVFHEKEGRRHCHAVWSRIDAEKMKAINLPFFHRKLMAISREQYLTHGWKMPRGLTKGQVHDPTNFTLAQHQQAKSIGKSAKEIKASLQDAWAISDNKTSFIHALRERGYWLARGDRRGYVVIDHEGEIYSAPKWLDVKTKAVQERIGPADALHSVIQTKAIIAQEMTPHLRKYLSEVKENFQIRKQGFAVRVAEMKVKQQAQRKELLAQQKARWWLNQDRRQQRFAKGLSGLWERLSGQYGHIRTLNEQEAREEKTQCRSERHDLRSQQLLERRKLQVLFLTIKGRQNILMRDIHRDIAHHIHAGKHAADDSRAQTTQHESARPRRRRRRQNQHHEQTLT